MLESNLHAVNNDVTDAQALLREAATLTGEKAETARNRGMQLLSAALARVQEAQASARIAGREMVASTDNYVKENPWKAVATAAGIGLLVGLILGRKQ